MQKLLSREEVAEMLGISSATLAVWACNKSQPLPFAKIGRCVRYRLADVEKFVSNRMQASFE